MKTIAFALLVAIASAEPAGSIGDRCKSFEMGVQKEDPCIDGVARCATGMTPALKTKLDTAFEANKAVW